MCVCLWTDWLRQDFHYDGNTGESAVVGKLQAACDCIKHAEMTSCMA